VGEDCGAADKVSFVSRQVSRVTRFAAIPYR
jgi:hypothetical protein